VASARGEHIFEGIMNAEGYVHTLEESLISSMQKLFGEDQYLFMQDNDPKHTSKCAQEFFARNRIERWRTPPESPDLNPIENLWHELKEYLRRVVKPMTKDQLIRGITEFWKTVTVWLFTESHTQSH
jgi:transposase